jgi:hypothetical protein
VRRLPVPGTIAAILLLSALWPLRDVAAQSDLDVFMQAVMARRDDNWSKLRQYILDEREDIDLRGPAGSSIWGERREYTWYIREGYFVRSPLKVNGATVGESDRRKYEADFLRREREREKRELESQRASTDSGPQSPSLPAGAARGPAPAGSAPVDTPPRDVDGLLRQGLQPQFVSSAYFLRFKFEQGRYALVGRESLDGREVLRVEYFPSRLFEEERQQRQRERRREASGATGAQVRQLLNRGSRVTLWIDPSTHQIVQYTFDNVDLDFFPAQWLASVTGIQAVMTMGQVFPDVWLPRSLGMTAGFMLAAGPFEVRYRLEYHDYRLADVSSTIQVPER